MARRIFLFAGVCAALSFACLSARRRFFTVEVAGESMLPTLEPGDFLIVRRHLPRTPHGRIAYLRAADGRPLLKRIVGAPGESVRVGDHVELNGRVLVEDYVVGVPSTASYRGVNRLTADEYFVLGDNRAASTDSRDFGPVSAEAIEGVAWLRYWPIRRFGVMRNPPRRFSTPPESTEDTAARNEAPLVPLRDEQRFGTTS